MINRVQNVHLFQFRKRKDFSKDKRNHILIEKYLQVINISIKYNNRQYL
jgi:hypothetical protein